MKEKISITMNEELTEFIREMASIKEMNFSATLETILYEMFARWEGVTWADKTLRRKIMKEMLDQQRSDRNAPTK